MSASVLRVALPGLVSWKRPRRMGRMTRYPADYALNREVWATWVRVAVAEQGWTAPDVKRVLRTDVVIVAGGKWDADRVVTAVLDALQGGGAIVDDCRAKYGSWATRAPARGEPERVEVALSEVGRAADPPPVPWSEIKG
jgi:hypothetical protein